MKLQVKKLIKYAHYIYMKIKTGNLKMRMYFFSLDMLLLVILLALQLEILGR